MVSDLERRVVIERISPEIDGGRFASKACAGDRVEVRACIHADGADVVAARLLYRRSDPDASEWNALPLQILNAGLDQWGGHFSVDSIGRYEFVLEGWIDRFATWANGLQKKAGAGLDVSSELQEGAALLRGPRRKADAPADQLKWLDARAAFLENANEPQGARVQAALDPALSTRMHTVADRGAVTVSRPLVVRVERTQARFSAWYEFFPRSASDTPGRAATLRDAQARLPDIATMGFDVVYLPPIHPIGRSHRKGPNNSTSAGPQDPGSPWAIGSEAGGHKSVEPALGTLDDFDEFQKQARALGMEIALDFALQCSPDHPYVREHPQWFRHRPDGSIKYAENPPKKYEDIYPIDFESADRAALWEELKSIVIFWAERGVRIFRVDNPHTKPYGFWEWLIDGVHAQFPDVIFLAEAFTRPAVMQQLGKLGFSQSYTYFTWRHTKAELTEYLTELSQPPVRDFMRPNFFANTPDILHDYLQHGGRPAFMIRLLLAATLSASYGIYGPPYELCEARAFPGTEDYVDSEKYQVRYWNRAQPGNISGLITAVNRIRREHPALQHTSNIAFHPSSNDHILFFSKEWSGDLLFIIINLDPHRAQEGWMDVPAPQFGLPASFLVRDLLADKTFEWKNSRNFVRLDPSSMPAHLLKVSRA